MLARRLLYISLSLFLLTGAVLLGSRLVVAQINPTVVASGDPIVDTVSIQWTTDVLYLFAFTEAGTVYRGDGNRAGTDGHFVAWDQLTLDSGDRIAAVVHAEQGTGSQGPMWLWIVTQAGQVWKGVGENGVGNAWFAHWDTAPMEPGDHATSLLAGYAPQGHLYIFVVTAAGDVFRAHGDNGPGNAWWTLYGQLPIGTISVQQSTAGEVKQLYR